LAALAVRGRAAKTGYDRAMFGQAWSDDVSVEGGHNGCDTRIISMLCGVIAGFSQLMVGAARYAY
jgi:hypothetical protein